MDAPGWDIGSVYRAKVYPTPHEDQMFLEYRKKFSEFIRSFRLGNEFVYREQLRRNLLRPEYFLEVELDHLVSYDEALANQIREYPIQYIPLFEEVVESVARQSGLIGSNVPGFQVMILSGANSIPLRSLDVSILSKLVRVSGIIVSASSITCKPTRLNLVCRSCRSVKFINVPAGLSGVQLPRKCDGSKQNPGSKDCPLDPYVVFHDKSKFVDQQLYKLQETPGSIPIGELARHVVLSTDRYITNKASPGTRVIVTGIFSLYNPPARSKAAKVSASIGTPYINVVGIQADVDANSNAERVFSEREEEEYLAMSRTKDIYELFSSSIAPFVYGGSDIKKAVACALFGGSRKRLPDGINLRGDINVLLLGDPGTAKSQILKFVEKVAPIAVYTSGKGSSAAGLTASVIRDPSTREFSLESGAMVLADGGIVCIDEFDKMREEDRVSIHEAMEQQTISIAKAGITAVLNSRTSVLAAANPVFGRYDDMKTAGENVDFQSTILSRFDLIFIVKDSHDRLRDEKIAHHVLQVHMHKSLPENEALDIDISKMKGYINFCRSRCHPRLIPESSAKLSNYFVEVRGKVRDMYEHDTRARSAIPITIRQLEAIIRVSEAIARMSLSKTVTESMVDEAIRLFNRSTMDAIETGVTEGYDSRSKFSNDVMRVENYICNMIPLGNKLGVRTVTEELLKKEFPRVVIDKAINILVMREVLQYTDRKMKILRISI